MREEPPKGRSPHSNIYKAKSTDFKGFPPPGTATMEQHKKRKIKHAEPNTGMSNANLHTDTNTASTTSNNMDTEHTHTLTHTFPHNTAKSPFVENLYNANDKGPLFKVILEKDGINEIAASRLLAKINIKYIEEIKKITKNRVQINLKDKFEANKIIQNQTLTKLNGYKCFIPNNFIISTGIIFDVPEDLTEEELYCSSRVPGNVPIEKIERILFWDKEKKITSNSNKIKIIFRSATLPETMFLFHVHKKVTPYIPRPTVCRKCLRFGHVAKICRSSSFACLNCSEETHQYDVNCNCQHCTKKCKSKCNSCKDEGHNVMFNACPEMIKQMKIKRIMVLQGVPFFDAKQIAEKKPDNCTYASISTLTSQIDELKAEVEKLKIQNLQIFQRSHSAETILKEIVGEAETLESTITDISIANLNLNANSNSIPNYNYNSEKKSKLLKAYAKHKKDFLDLKSKPNNS